MATIDTHVDVQIAKETATVSRIGFGIPAVLTYHTRFPEIFREYASLTEMTDDGFATTDLAYKMTAAIFAQNPKPSRVVVGRRATAPTRDIKMTPKSPVLAATQYWITINGEKKAFTTDVTPTVAEITAGLTTAIDGGTQNVNATDNTTDLDIESADAPGGTPTAGVPFTVAFDPLLFELDDATADAGLATELTTLRGANDDWYGIVVDEWGAAGIAAMATAIESATAPKIYSAESQDSDIVESGSSDIASTLQTAAHDRTFLTYHYDVDPSPAAAWLGKQLPTDPGSTTWKFKTLATVSAASLTTGQNSQAVTKNCNTYQEVGGINITAEGVAASGEFIDVTRFIDWLTARLKENVFRALAVNPKIPYTDSGIQAIVNEVEGVLRRGISLGGINGDEDFTVTAPRASEIDANTKASRLLPDIRFLATLAGAIHKVEIRGTVTV